MSGAGRAGPVRAALYLRVSTAGQVEGTSIDSQRAQCEAVATGQGFVVAAEFVDAGVSGAKASRPALDQLLAAAAVGEIDVVVIAKLDRLGRSLLHLLTLISHLDTLGVRVISASDQIDTKTPAGRMMLQLLGVFAEFERERIRERSVEGARRRVQDGGFVSSTPPFGYAAVPDPAGRRGVVLAIDPPQAACIQEMYRLLVAQRVTISRATHLLNDAGHRSASGAAWTPGTLMRWARGDGPATAAGTYCWNELTVAIPPILTVQQHREWVAWRTDTAQPQRERGPYLLGGLATTPCGRAFHGRSAGTQTPVYACRHRLSTKAGDPDRCGCRTIPVATLDDTVWTQLTDALTHPHLLAELIENPTSHGSGGGGLDIGAGTLTARIVEAADTVARLQHAVAAEYQAAREDGYDPATSRLMIAPLHADLQHAQTELSRLSRVRAALSPAAVDSNRRIRGSRHVTDHAHPDLGALELSNADLDGLDLPGRQRLLHALGVTVRVTGYTTCADCGGTGYHPVPAGYGRHWPPSCRTCRRTRVSPEVTVRVTAPEALAGVIADVGAPADATAGTA